MYQQLQKLAIICNVCFLATLVFQVWEKARAIPEQILNTIVILGVSALLVNIFTLALGYYFNKKKAGNFKMTVCMNWMIVIFAIVQVGWLAFFRR